MRCYPRVVKLQFFRGGLSITGKSKALLLYGLVLAAMFYAAWNLDLSILTKAEADWPGGCCGTSMDCKKIGELCWHINGAGDCGVRPGPCPDSAPGACPETQPGYCNKTNPNDKGPAPTQD